MVTDSLAPPKEKNGDKPCRCGCAPCEETCCRLECLVQPRFFCGQLLTDQDLKALVDWTASKFRLTRYRHGWGVVCGLEVRVDPKRPAGIIIAPGYAVDCCGHDIIVCEEYWYDLGKWCPAERCGEPYSPGTSGRYERGGNQGSQQEPVDTGDDNGSPFDRLMARATTVDLAIAYDEQGIEPKTTLGRCGCGNTSTCENSRTKEAFKLVVSTPKTAADAVEKADEDYRVRLQTFAGFAGEITAKRGEVRRRLLEWIDEHPLQEFAFVSRLIAQSADSDLAADGMLFSLLYWLFLDYRAALIRCGCYECETDIGVPLARIWLDAADRAAGARCQVIAIDWRPPYRRPLSPLRCRPVPDGCVDLSSAIWRDPKDARQLLGAAARLLYEREVQVPATLQEITDAIKCARYLSLCGDRLDMQFIDAGPPFGKRVVGFCPAASTSTVRKGTA